MKISNEFYLDNLYFLCFLKIIKVIYVCGNLNNVEGYKVKSKFFLLFD